MPEIDIASLLKNYGLSITDARKMVLSAFVKNRNALTQRDICNFTDTGFDRVTIYRTLEVFVEKGIIHIIPSMDTIKRYSLVRSINNADCYQNHLHFLCDNCEKTICFDMMPVPSISLPAGFSVKETEVIIKGTCKDCK
ncbi:MAG: transcriptional repressor [Ferruginibacter sp.]